MAKVTKIKAAADPFASIARKVNEVIDANPPLVAGAGVSIVESKERRLITVTGVGGSGDVTRTFFTTSSGTADLTVSAGAINNVAYAGGTLTAPANGDKVYIDATISGTTVTAVTVAKAASVPANTSTHVYTLLATVAVASSIATATPVAWNYSQMQICGSYASAYWGGFGE